MFICVEGIDGTGKSTLIDGLCELLPHFIGADKHVERMKFPTRTTQSSILINCAMMRESYIQPQALHLLFSADRWETIPYIRERLDDPNTILLADRYIWSGQAYSIARGLDSAWVCSSDYGIDVLPSHLVYLYGDVNECYNRTVLRTAVKERSEVTPEFLERVKTAYDDVLPRDPTENMRIIRINVDLHSRPAIVNKVVNWVLGTNLFL